MKPGFAERKAKIEAEFRNLIQSMMPGAPRKQQEEKTEKVMKNYSDMVDTLGEEEANQRILKALN